MKSRKRLIDVQIATRARSVPAPARFKRWARAAWAGDGEVTLRVVAQSEARALNQRYRGRDYATNVLSFGYESGLVICGDVVLCASVVAREARQQKKEIDAHYAHLTVHGMLHLRGYDHESDPDARRMERRERAILADLGFSDPYQ